MTSSITPLLQLYRSTGHSTSILLLTLVCYLETLVSKLLHWIPSTPLIDHTSSFKVYSATFSYPFSCLSYILVPTHSRTTPTSSDSVLPSFTFTLRMSLLPLIDTNIYHLLVSETCHLQGSSTLVISNEHAICLHAIHLSTIPYG